MELKDVFKGFTLDQDKLISPEITLEKVKAKLNSLNLKILEKTIRIDNGRLDIPVYISLCGSEAHKIIGNKKQMGKGATKEQAEASAIMELVERYSFFTFSKTETNFFYATYEEAKSQALPIEFLAKAVDDKSEEPEILTPILKQLSLKWTKGYNLTKKQEVLIPFDWFYAINEFNGPSAGNCNEEAICQGICEIVERHVSALISHHKIKVSAINSASITDPIIKNLLRKYQKNNIKLYLSDFSLNLGIPSVGVLAYDPANFPLQSEIVWTAGTTPNPQKALSRALTEVAQLAGDFNTGSIYVASGLPKPKNIQEMDFIINPEQTCNIERLPDLSNANLKIEIENLLRALEKHGFETLLINTTHPLLQIPAFYTIIPGAHFRERANGSLGLFLAKIITEKYSVHKAFEILTKMDSLLPQKYYLKFYLGIIYFKKHAFLEAIDLFEQALNLNPKKEDLTSIYIYIATCFKDLDKYNDSLEVLKKAEANDPDSPEIHNLMGFCYFKVKQHLKAIESFEKVLTLNPGSAIDYANIASNYRELGKKEKAIHYYQMALALNPELEFAIHNLQNLIKPD